MRGRKKKRRVLGVFDILKTYVRACIRWMVVTR
jgi:hypothetical protein